MSIKRIKGKAAGRCRAVASDGVVYAVATDPSGNPSVKVQTRNALVLLEEALECAGGNKQNLLQATIYLNDMSTKSEMDAVWNEWIGPEENWPQRACVGADLAGDILFEIVVTAKAVA